MSLGLTIVAAVPLVALPTTASAEMYGPDVGTEIMPGIRQVAIGEWPVQFGGYTKAVVNDYVLAPGTAFPEDVMKNDMICQIMEGEFMVTKDGEQFQAKSGHVFSCVIGTVEADKNAGAATAIMRVIDLLAA